MAQALEPKSPDGRIFSTEGEGQRLWNQLTKGMDGIYRVAKDYAEINMPGDPLPQLLAIHADLGEVIKHIQKR